MCYLDNLNYPFAMCQEIDLQTINFNFISIFQMNKYVTRVLKKDEQNI